MNTDYEITCKLRYLVNKGKSISFISSRLGLTEGEITRFLFDNDYSIDGNRIVKNDNIDIIEKNLGCYDNNINLLVLSDTHLGNNNDRIDLLKRIYDKALDNHVDYIFHLGDLGNGINKESRCNNFDSLKNYCIRYYPYSIIKTYFISGNHDYFNKEEKDLVEEVIKFRSDLVYLGKGPVLVNLNDMKLLLVHGDYNKRYYYKIMKSLKGDVLMYGHEHRYALNDIKGFKELKVPSLVDDGKKDMGVWWLTLCKNNEITYELETFPKKVLKK